MGVQEGFAGGFVAWIETSVPKLFPLSSEGSEDKSVSHLEKKPETGCRWWVDSPLCAVNVDHFVVFPYCISLKKKMNMIIKI